MTENGKRHVGTLFLIINPPGKFTVPESQITFLWLPNRAVGLVFDRRSLGKWSKMDLAFVGAQTKKIDRVWGVAGGCVYVYMGGT